MDQKVPERRRAMDFVLLLLVMLLKQEVAALELLQINVPAYILRGKTALLECKYDLGTDNLYSIIWSKDHEVFYKYILQTKEAHSYLVNGVKVDKEQSNDQMVVLQNASLHASGKYKCEVNAEAPNFNSVSAEANMEVIAISQESPAITGEEKVYANGDVLALNCTSGKSFPAAKIKWFVNGEQVKSDSEMMFEQHGLYSTISSLLLELEPGHLASDKINVRCEATVQSSQKVGKPFVDTRNTEVFVQSSSQVSNFLEWGSFDGQQKRWEKPRRQRGNQTDTRQNHNKYINSITRVETYNVANFSNSNIDLLFRERRARI